MLTKFGKILRIIRMNTGDNAENMAKKLYISQSYLYLIENGKRRIPVDIERNIINAYQISESERKALHRAIIEEQIGQYETDDDLSEKADDSRAIIERDLSNENAEPSDTSDPKKNGRKRRGIIIVITAVAAAIIVSVILILNHNGVFSPEPKQPAKTGRSATMSTELFEYREVDDSICITKYIGADKNVTVPSEIDGKSVYEVAERAFAGNRTVKKVVFSDGIKRIGFHACEDCTNLEYIEVPDSVYYIGDGFAINCENLVSVVLGDGNTFISDWSFWKCTSLKSIKIGKNVCQIGINAFNSCESLTEIDLPDSLLKIDALAFYGCTGLKNVVLKDGITSIGDRAFGLCSDLESIYVPSSFRWFSSGIFQDCPKLTVWGEADSTIHMYCADNGYNFKAIADGD